MDANEMEPDSVLAIIKLVYVLSADGTYNISLNGYPTSKGTWSLVNNNTYLQLTDTSGSHVNNIYNLVESIGSTSLEIKDTVNAARGGTSWLYFTKQ